MIDRRGVLAGAAGLTVAGRAGQAEARGADPVAVTRHGRVRGRFDDGVAVFRGLPYGRDTAQTRFSAPLAARPWRGVIDAADYGPRAPQTGSGRIRGYGEGTPDLPPQSEDMLRLNVWTPGLDGARRPVLVWLHPGGFSGFSADDPLTDGKNLARRGDMVVVSLNHRLNLFGFLYLGGLDARFADSGNAGMLDIVLALEWVRDTIAAFGGDPANVTLFGQSGGGAKASVLMAMPRAQGLFHRVMTMSGQQVTVTSPEMAAETARAVLDAAGLAAPADLLPLPMERLVEISRAGRYYGPVLDGRSLTRHPFDPDATPLSRDIPLVMGNTHDETTSLIGAANPDLFDLTWDALPAALERHIRAFLGPFSGEQVAGWYRDLHPGYSPAQVFFSATTALRSWRAQVIQAERRAQQAGARTWVYQFDWKSPVEGGRWGAPHMGDIPFMFANIALSTATTGAGAQAHALSDRMSAALIAFARTGDPNTPTLPHWPEFTLPERRTMIFDSDCRVVSDPRGEERRLAGLIPYRQPGT